MVSVAQFTQLRSSSRYLYEIVVVCEVETFGVIVGG